MTLRNRFTFFFVTFAVATTLVAGSLAWHFSSRALEDEFDRKLTSVAQVAAELGIQADQVVFFERGDEKTDLWMEYRSKLLRLRNRYVDVAAIFRWKPGDPVATALVTAAPQDSVSPGQALPWVQLHLPELGRAYEVGWATTPRESYEDQHFKYGFIRLKPSEVFLGVRMPTDYREPVARLSRSIVIWTVAAAALAGLAGWRFAGGIVARLESLSLAALRIQRGRVDRPIQVEGEDELARLARAMERMRTGIRRRDEQLRLMLSRVAHEIRNPLGGLELFASAAQAADDPEERHRILGRVRKEILGLNAIIEEFLGFARPGNAEPKLHDVRDPVEEAVALAEAEMAKKGGTMHLEFPKAPLLALADPAQVKRLVLNLLRNSCHAGDTVWVQGEMLNGEVRIAIRDDGPGIAEELRDRIFEPFVSDKEKGAGLGLAIVREIAEASQGRVEVAPSLNDREKSAVGAEFHVYLKGPEDLPTGGALQKSNRGGAVG